MGVSVTLPPAPNVPSHTGQHGSQQSVQPHPAPPWPRGLPTPADRPLPAVLLLQKLPSPWHPLRHMCSPPCLTAHLKKTTTAVGLMP